MRYSLALGGPAMALALILIWTEQPVPNAQAAPSMRLQHARAGVAATAVEGEKVATGQTHRADTTTKETAPVVRELDLDGLKKLLQRDPAEGRDARPLLVNFWATWCEPCREEFPDLVLINKDYGARGLDFITVSLDDPSEINTKVPEFLREMRAPMPAYLLNTIDPEIVIKAVDAQWGGGLPATFLYDASGRMVFKHTGRVKAEELRAVIDKVTSGK